MEVSPGDFIGVSLSELGRRGGGWEADRHSGAAGVGAGALVQPEAQLPAQLVPVPGAPS